MHATFEPRGPAVAIVLTDEQVTALGEGKAFPVRVTVNGVTIAARVARMGGENLLGSARNPVPISVSRSATAWTW